MKTYRLLSVMILAAWLGSSAAYGQQSTYEPIFPPPSPTGRDGAPDLPVVTPVFAGGGMSDWIVYKRDCCEGKPGERTPLYTEIYLSSGPSIPMGGMTLSRELRTGWSITGGSRALFFNEPMTSAWVVDAHLINTNESAGKQNTQFPITFFQNGVRSDQVVFQGAAGRQTFSLQNSNRTLVGLGLGRDWYLRQPANADGANWRVGIDGGGRYGSHRVNFNEFGHVVDVVGSMYAAIHTEVEIPWHSALFHAGFRCEWAYTWSDILQRTSDIQDLSVLFSIGVRF